MVYAPFQTRFLANFRKSLTTPTLFTRKYVENCFCIRDDKNEYQKYYTESWNEWCGVWEQILNKLDWEISEREPRT